MYIWCSIQNIIANIDDDLTMISRKYPPVLRVEDISNAQCKHLFRFEKGG